MYARFLTAAVLALLAPFIDPAAAQSAKPAIVLVHGAWADGSSWGKVIPRSG